MSEQETKTQGNNHRREGATSESIREGGQLTGRDIFKVLFRRKWVILLLFLTTLIFVLWQASQIPTEYRATAEVLINRGQRKSALDRNVSLLTWDETVATELQIAESRPVIKRAQEMLDMEAEANGTEPIEIIGNKVRSRLMEESNVVGIMYTSLNEEDARPVANALATAYIEYHKKLFALPDATSFFVERVESAEDNLTDLMSRRQAIKEAGTITRMTTQQDLLLQEMRTIRETLMKDEKEYAAMQTELEQARRLYSGGVDMPFGTTRDEGNAGLARIMLRLKEDLLKLKQNRDQLLTKYTPQHPQVLALDDQIVKLQASLTDETGQVLQVKESEIAIKRSEIQDLRESLNNLNAKMREMPRIERELDDLDRSIDLASKAYQELLDNQVRIQVAEVSSRDFTLTLLSEAGAPIASNPRDPVRLALVPAFSLLVGVSLAFFLETMDHSFKSREDVERYLDLSVLASVPDRKKALTR
ncbi:MAG: hypothetical protein HKN20_12230 [Gemmatimonadetes bacterium]|nr:hypothetical protein [Gemmatimonadota bacterium]